MRFSFVFKFFLNKGTIKIILAIMIKNNKISFKKAYMERSTNKVF